VNVGTGPSGPLMCEVLVPLYGLCGPGRTCENGFQCLNGQCALTPPCGGQEQACCGSPTPPCNSSSLSCQTSKCLPASACTQSAELGAGTWNAVNCYDTTEPVQFGLTVTDTTCGPLSTIATLQILDSGGTSVWSQATPLTLNGEAASQVLYFGGQVSLDAGNYTAIAKIGSGAQWNYETGFKVIADCNN